MCRLGQLVTRNHHVPTRTERVSIRHPDPQQVGKTAGDLMARHSPPLVEKVTNSALSIINVLETYDTPWYCALPS